MTDLGGRDVRRAQELINVAYTTKAPAQFAESVVEALARVVPGEVVGYNERELESRQLRVGAETPTEASSPEVSTAVSEFCGDYALSMQRHYSETRALKISDLLSRRQLHQLDYYNYALRPLEIEHQIRLWLAAPTGVARYLYIGRRQGSGDFTERDRDLLELVRPFLNALHERFDQQDLDETDDNCLTEREVEILSWVARGKTNYEIAALLVVSPHTIRKHLEHAYEKLRVHTRTAAVARAFATSI
jgi:DNA-binding CsgD family transcriptional regulator